MLGFAPPEESWKPLGGAWSEVSGWKRGREALISQKQRVVGSKN